MLQYLTNLSNYVGHQSCALLLDVYTAHRTDAIKRLARELGIELVYIPPGCTDICQPLDISVFAVLKGYARARWRAFYHENGEQRMSWSTLIEHLAESWEAIRQGTILKGWEQYCFHGIDIGDEVDDDDDDGSGLFSVDESILREDSSSEWEMSA